MPIYEYKCEQCGDVFERIEKFSDEPLAVHDKCGGPVHRLISAAALQFKGSGWYVNDYARAGAKPEASGNGSEKSDGASESKTESKSESKSETKSEAKSETKSESKAETSKSDSSSSTKTPA